MKDLIRDTLNKIEEKHIQPEPRWKFVLRKSALWFLIGLVVFLGSASISVVYFLLAQLDWDLYRFMHQSRFTFTLSVLPYFWIILIAIFVAAAFFGVRKTETGYRFKWLAIILATLAGAIVVGFLISLAGFDRRFNDTMMHRMPYYAQNIQTKEKQWMQPESGFLAGAISSVSGNEIGLIDLDEGVWRIIMDEKTLVRPSADISKGQMIKIIGEKKSGQEFVAVEIRPWAGRGMMGGGDQDGSCNAGIPDACPNRRGMMNR